MNASSPQMPVRSSLTGCVTAASIMVASFVSNVADAAVVVQQTTSSNAPFAALDEETTATHSRPALEFTESSPLLRMVKERVELSEGAVWAQAEQLIEKLNLALSRFDVPKGQPLAATFRDDRSLMVEWVQHDRRLSFSIDQAPNESSWHFAKANGDLACGELEGAAITGVLSMFLGAEPR